MQFVKLLLILKFPSLNRESCHATEQLSERILRLGLHGAVVRVSAPQSADRGFESHPCRHGHMSMQHADNEGSHILREIRNIWTVFMV